MILKEIDKHQFFDSTKKHPLEYQSNFRDFTGSFSNNVKLGLTVKFKTYVHRVGYEWSYTHIHLDTRIDLGIKVFLKSHSRPEISPQHLKIFLSHVSPNTDPFSYGYKKQIFAEFLKTRELETPNQRSMWFVDLDKPMTGEVINKVSKWTGVYIVKQHSDEDYGERPMQLKPKYHQHLLAVKVNVFRTLWVYPHDVEILHSSS